MAYPPRIYQARHWYHVYARGQRKDPLFFSPDDRKTYLRTLDYNLSRQGGAIGSYCLMSNHVHLLLKMEETPLGKILQATHTKYALTFNERHRITGHVFEGRPGVKIVLEDQYLKTLVGYIHRNPIEAGLVHRLMEYEWSSWPLFLGKPLYHVELSSWEFPPGFDEVTRKHTFLEMTRDDDLDWPEGDAYIGNEQQWDNLEKREEGREGHKFRERRDRPTKQEIAGDILEETNHTLSELQSPSRNRSISTLRQEAMNQMYLHGYGPTEIAKFFNRTPRAVTKAHQKWKSRSQ